MADDAITVTQADRILADRVFDALPHTVKSHMNFTNVSETIARHRTTSLAAQDGLVEENERLRKLVQTYRGAQLRAEEKLCREQANAKGWKVRAERLEAKLAAQDVDSGMSGDSVERAEWFWANLPTGRKWAGLSTHEKALVCHQIARIAPSLAAQDGLVEALENYLEAEEIDDPVIRMQELSVCREQARQALSAIRENKS